MPDVKMVSRRLETGIHLLFGRMMILVHFYDVVMPSVDCCDDVMTSVHCCDVVIMPDVSMDSRQSFPRTGIYLYFIWFLLRMMMSVHCCDVMMTSDYYLDENIYCCQILIMCWT